MICYSLKYLTAIKKNYHGNYAGKVTTLRTPKSKSEWWRELRPRFY